MSTERGSSSYFWTKVKQIRESKFRIINTKYGCKKLEMRVQLGNYDEHVFKAIN